MYLWGTKMELKAIGYGIRVQEELNIIISRDVIFNENVFHYRLENLETDPKPSVPDDFVIIGNTQF